MTLIDGGNLEADAVNSASGVIMRYGLRSMMRVQFEVATAWNLIDSGNLEAEAVKVADHPRPCFRAAKICGAYPHKPPDLDAEPYGGTPDKALWGCVRIHTDT